MVEVGRHVGLWSQERGMASAKYRSMCQHVQFGGILRTSSKKSWVLSSNLTFVTEQLHDLGQVTEIVWISVSSSMKWGGLDYADSEVDTYSSRLPYQQSSYLSGKPRTQVRNLTLVTSLSSSPSLTLCLWTSYYLGIQQNLIGLGHCIYASVTYSQMQTQIVHQVSVILPSRLHLHRRSTSEWGQGHVNILIVLITNTTQ